MFSFLGLRMNTVRNKGQNKKAESTWRRWQTLFLWKEGTYFFSIPQLI
jgi:hypothetical protein